MKARWMDVLDIQLHLAAFMTSELGQMFGGGWFISQFTGERDWLGPEPAWAKSMFATREEAQAAGEAWSAAEGTSLFNAEPIYVDEEMMKVVDAAIAGFDLEPLLETDLITPNGLLVLPEPMWMVPTVEGAYALNWSVAHWRPLGGKLGPGIQLTLYHDEMEPDPLDEHEAEEVLKRGPAMQARYKRFMGHARYLPTHVVNWSFGKMHPGYDSHYGHEHAALALQALWRLMNQTLAIRTKTAPPKPFLKRAKRGRLPGELITVVKLRRLPSHVGEPGEEREVNWTHRWLVGGHWRQQWYPSIQAHRQIWISPYVKGPEELPLELNKGRMYALVR